MKFEKIYILKSNGKEKVKKEIKARTFIIDGHKFALQGDTKTGYSISDAEIGVLIGIHFDRLKDFTHEKMIKISDYLEYITTDKKGIKLYNEIKEDYERAKFLV